jgi:hypothetical protein
MSTQEHHSEKQARKPYYSPVIKKIGNSSTIKASYGGNVTEGSSSGYYDRY